MMISVSVCILYLQLILIYATFADIDTYRKVDDEIQLQGSFSSKLFCGKLFAGCLKKR